MPRDPEKLAAKRKRWSTNPKRKIVQKRYQQSEKGIEAGRNYDHSSAGRIMRRLWNQRPEVRRKKVIQQQLRRQNGR